MARRDEGAYPPAVCDRGATTPEGLFRENPKGGGSFARGRRWLDRHSPLRGCSGLAALAATKIPRRRNPRNFKTRSQSRGKPGVRHLFNVRTPDAECRMPNAECRMPNVECRMSKEGILSILFKDRAQRFHPSTFCGSLFNQNRPSKH